MVYFLQPSVSKIEPFQHVVTLQITNGIIYVLFLLLSVWDTQHESQIALGSHTQVLSSPRPPHWTAGPDSHTWGFLTRAVPGCLRVGAIRSGLEPRASFVLFCFVLLLFKASQPGIVQNLIKGRP